MQSLDDIMSARGEPAPVETNAPEPISDAERAADPIGSAQRDAQGRFAKTGPQGEPLDDPTVDANPDPNAAPADGQGSDQPRKGTVPQQALEAERRKRQERDDQIAELLRQNAALIQRLGQPQQPVPQQPQQPAAPPEFYEDHNKWHDHRTSQALDPIQQNLRAREQREFDLYQRIAVLEHGADTVKAALQAAGDLSQADPVAYKRLDQHVTSSRDPVGEIVRWHKQQHALNEVGSDLAAYKERVRQEILAEMQGTLPPEQQQPADRRTPPPRLPTSFAGAPGGGGPRGGAGYGGARSLSEIMPRG